MSKTMQSFRVIAISPGVAIGKVLKVRRQSRMPEPEKTTIADPAAECQRFRTAVARAKEQLVDLKRKLGDRIEPEQAQIIDAHLLLVDDRTFLAEVENRINSEQVGAEYALFGTTEHFVSLFNGIPDPYLQERGADLRDLAARMMANLGDVDQSGTDLDDRRIIVAEMLAPSETMQLDSSKVIGFAVESGSATSHTAILARSMRLPAIAGLPPEVLDSLQSGDTVIVDGFIGRFIVNPDERTEDAYRERARSANQLMAKLSEENALRPETIDGFTVEIAANIDAAEQFAEAKNSGAFGVGLFRTEFMFMDDHIPDEEEQFEIYRDLLFAAGDNPVTVRTLDLGGDKLSQHVSRSIEVNPALGLRGIRLCLYERRDLFETQLRALLRAAFYGNLRIMLPMVCSVAEIVETKDIINQIQNQLIAEKVEFGSRFQLGAMIETPAAALNAGEIAGQVDFFSIGTNDLVQYTMAIDRMNEKVSYLNRASAPPVLRLIRFCVSCAEEHGIPVSVCGQMAADPAMALLLIGMGVNELSMASPAIPLVRRAIRSVSLYETEQLVESSFNCADEDEPARLAENLLRRRAPELLDM